ncbi:hypothetical protein BC830DRAFT_697581, partial [Chytriomyces sp. MP71]
QLWLPSEVERRLLQLRSVTKQVVHHHEFLFGLGSPTSDFDDESDGPASRVPNIGCHINELFPPSENAAFCWKQSSRLARSDKYYQLTVEHIHAMATYVAPSAPSAPSAIAPPALTTLPFASHEPVQNWRQRHDSLFPGFELPTVVESATSVDVVPEKHLPKLKLRLPRLRTTEQLAPPATEALASASPPLPKLKIRLPRPPTATPLAPPATDAPAPASPSLPKLKLRLPRLPTATPLAPPATDALAPALPKLKLRLPRLVIALDPVKVEPIAPPGTFSPQALATGHSERHFIKSEHMAASLLSTEPTKACRRPAVRAFAKKPKAKGTRRSRRIQGLAP